MAYIISENYSISELKNLASKNKIRGFSYCRTKFDLMKLLSDHNVLPDVAPPDERVCRLRNKVYNPKKVIITNTDTREVEVYPSIYRASLQLAVNPNIIKYWDGRVYRGKYDIKIVDKIADDPKQ